MWEVRLRVYDHTAGQVDQAGVGIAYTIPFIDNGEAAVANLFHVHVEPPIRALSYSRLAPFLFQIRGLWQGTGSFSELISDRSSRLSLGCLEYTGSYERDPRSTQVSCEANKAVVRRVFEEIIDGGRLDLAPTLLRPDYVQHNPSVGQGLDGFVAYFTNLEQTKKRLRVGSELFILHMLAEDDLVFIHTKTTMKGLVTLDFETMDLFRLCDGLLAEHWDVIKGRSVLASLALLMAG